ncbi:hypothetical protein OHT76_42235 [Streptomyces sp. NBC_00287]|uniref:hypothetical protein n=1 Tax=Streptomyces sp. NBC_00287 TaxID=2975702 RepID=UPI002E2BD657|nr:hypothetical protein [Streptomyces sp. NBC_00287]
MTKLRRTIIAAAAVAAPLSMTAVPAASATDSAKTAIDCTTGYEHVTRWNIKEGETQIEPNGNYFLPLYDGTATACLDGPDGTTLSLHVQQHFGTEGWKTVGSAPQAGADKQLAHNVAGYTWYRLAVTAVGGGGTYTVGLNFPE